ncbi:MAG: AarF/ABC1/UbiB kinase family protein [Gemmatimonadales bacterium]|nr:AarF/ABC1/UbiB kinase family protein [Gemmatimonadales bacterium]
MRAVQVFFQLLPFVVAFLVDRRRFLIVGRPARRSVERHRRRAERLATTVAELGPTFIKLAQIFAARADILPEPYLSAIGTLTDRVPPLAPGVAERVIREELGQEPAALFDRFDAAPLAAASLGQVHRATYRGREVVVKVLRPGVEELVRQDLEVSFRILFLLNALFPSHQVRAISAIVTEFSRRVSDELDFRQEARNAEELRRNFAGNARVIVPAVEQELTRQRVLVLEFIEGTHVDRLHDRLARGDIRLGALVEAVIEVYVKMMLEDGVFHADPHAGNLMVAPDGRLVLLDFGMVLRVDVDTRRRLMQTALAVVRQDVDGVIGGFYELGILDPEVDRGTIRDAAQRLMAVVQKDDLSSRQIQRVVEEVLRTFYDWPLMLPSNLVYFGRAAVLVEGIGLRYDPDFNVLAVARPVAARSAVRLLQGTEGDVRTRLTDWTLDAASAVRTLRDILRRVEREELRVRWHPRDSLELQRFLAQQVRRALLALFAFTIALIASVIYLATRRLAVLVVGLVLAFGLFLVIFLLPNHLFQNPLRLRRSWPGR